MCALALCRAGPEDVEAVIRHVQSGFDSYTAFAHPGWRAPDVGEDRAALLDRLADPDTWGLLARWDGEPVGHVAFMSGRERAPADDPRDWRARRVIPGLAHLWQLFVLEPWWGRGVAAALHEAAVSEMRERGFTHGRLYTPSQHARARRFYERRGWTPYDEAFHPGLTLVLTEYHLALSEMGHARDRLRRTGPGEH